MFTAQRYVSVPAYSNGFTSTKRALVRNIIRPWTVMVDHRDRAELQLWAREIVRLRK